MDRPIVPTIRLGEIEIDILSREVRAGASVIHLWGIEQSLLYLLASRAGRVVTRDEILDAIWGTDFVAESNVVDRHIRSLRIKLQNDYRHPRFIATVPGRGYRFIPTFSNAGWGEGPQAAAPGTELPRLTLGGASAAADGAIDTATAIGPGDWMSACASSRERHPTGRPLGRPRMSRGWSEQVARPDGSRGFLGSATYGQDAITSSRSLTRGVMLPGIPYGLQLFSSQDSTWKLPTSNLAQPALKAPLVVSANMRECRLSAGGGGTGPSPRPALVARLEDVADGGGARRRRRPVDPPLPAGQLPRALAHTLPRVAALAVERHPEAAVPLGALERRRVMDPGAPDGAPARGMFRSQLIVLYAAQARWGYSSSPSRA